LCRKNRRAMWNRSGWRGRGNRSGRRGSGSRSGRRGGKNRSGRRNRRYRTGRRSRRNRDTLRRVDRSLVDHAILHVLHVRPDVAAVVRADRIVGDALVDGLRHVERTDVDRRRVDPVQKPARWFSEEGDRRDVVCDLGRHWSGDAWWKDVTRGDFGRGDVTDHSGPLGVPAKHHLGGRTLRGHFTNPSARVDHTFSGGGEVCTCRVVNRIRPHGLGPELRLQRIHERLSDAADARWLGGAASEHHLDVWASSGLRSRNANWRTRQRRNCRHRGTNRANDPTCTHVTTPPTGST
jgi:hypothetical protein